MEKIKIFIFSSLPYLIFVWSGFYLLPLLIGSTISAIFLLLICLPILVFIVSFMYGLKVKHYYLLFSILIGLSFIPAIYIFMNDTALIYVVAYAVISLVSSLIGHFIAGKN